MPSLRKYSSLAEIFIEILFTMKVFFSLLFVTLTTLLLSCNHKSDQKLTTIINRDQTFFDPLTLGRFNKSDDFTISAGFCECGEWGGHDEEIRIYSDSNSILHANYIVYNYNCDSALSYGYARRLGINSTKIISLDKYKKGCIVNFIHTMLTAKIGEFPIPSHATNSYKAILSDSSLIISIRDNSSLLEDNYKKLISELF